MPAGAGQIFVDLLLQTQAFEQKMNTTLNQIKQFGTHTTDLSTSVTKVDQAFGTTATKMQDLANKTGTLSQKTQELKPKEDAAAQGAAELGNKAQKAGTDLQTMSTKGEQAGSRLQQLGSSFKQSALAIAGFSTSLFNTYMQYDSIKDQELTLERTRRRLADETTNVQNSQDALNKAIQEETISNEDAIIKQREIDENLANLQIKQELYTDAVEDHKNAWRGFALSLAPTVITGLASIQAFMSKTGTSAVAATTGVKTFGGGVGAMMLRVAPFTLAIGAIVAAFLAIKNNTFGARDSLQAFGKSLGDAMPILKPVLTFIEQLGGFLGLAGDRSAELKTQFMETIGAMGAAITGFGQSIVTGVTGFKDWIMELITYAQQSGDYAGAIQQLVDDIKENFFNFLTFAQTDIVPAVTSFITTFQTEVIGRIPELITAIIDGITGAWEWTADAIDTIWQAFQDEVQTWFDDNAEGMVEDWIRTILEAFGWSQDDIDKIMEDFTKFMEKWAENPGEALKELGKKIGEAVVKAIVWTGENFANLYNTYVAPLLTEISAFLQKQDWAAIGKSVGEWIVGAITFVGDVVTAAYTKAWEGFATGAETGLTTAKTGDAWKTFGENIGNAIVDIITFTPEAIQKFFGAMWKALIGEDNFNMVQSLVRFLGGEQQFEPADKQPVNRLGAIDPKTGRPFEPTPTTIPGTSANEMLRKTGALDAIINPLPTLINKIAEQFSKGTVFPSFPEAGGQVVPDAIAKRTLTQQIDAALLGYPSGGYPTVTNPYEGLPFNPDKQTIQYATLSNEMMAKINKEIFGKPGAFQFPYTAPESITQNATLPSRFTEEAVATRMGIGAGGAGAGAEAAPTDPAALAAAWEDAAARIQAALEQISTVLLQFETVMSEFTIGVSEMLLGMSTNVSLVPPVFQSMAEEVGVLLLQLETVVSEFAIGVSQMALGMSQNISLIPPVFLTMSEEVGEILLALMTVVSEFAIGTSEIFLGLATNVSLLPPVFLKAGEEIGTILLDTMKVISEFAIGSAQIFLDFAKVLEEFSAAVGRILTQASAHFVVMKDSIKSTFALIEPILTDFTDTTMQTFADDTSKHTTSVSGSFLAMRESVEDNIDQIIDDIDELIDKLEELAEAQDEADSGGGGGGESELEWFGTGRYGLQFVTPSFRRGGSFISKKARKFRGANISEFDKWELVTVTPLSNPSNDQDKNSRVREIAGAEEVNYSGGMARRQSPIIVNGTLNAVLVTPNGRELAKTSSPFILEYSEAQY